MRKHLPVFVLCVVLLAIAAVPAGAGTDRVKFPAGYKSFVHYATVERADNKTVRLMYADPATVAAVKAGKPASDGAVIVMEVYRGEPAPGGGLKRGAFRGIFVMEKGAGWGAEYPDTLRNGDWEYARFDADGKRNKKRNMNSCFTCHKKEAVNDYVFTAGAMKAK
ncbi:MAG: hypothetical protein GEU76_15510 [Alphaproteobacteria bacterium]|nr:hypothetical protein [Alphaproteobacteria bacterium]